MHDAEDANVVRARRAENTEVASGGGLVARLRECRKIVLGTNTPKCRAKHLRVHRSRKK
jgi:hypothetical protein